MNDTLNLKRLGVWALRSWGLYAKQYLTLIAVVAAAMIVPLVFERITNGDVISDAGIGNYSEFWTSVLLVFYIVGFTVVTMKPLKNRFSLVMENTAPVSITEKWLFVILNSTVVAAILFGVTMVVTACVGLMLFQSGTFVDYFNPDSEWWSSLVWTILCVQGLTMFAGTLERRNHLVSLMLTVLVIVGAMLFLFGFPMWYSDRFDTTFLMGPMFTFGHSEVHSELSRISYSGFKMMMLESGGSGDAVMSLYSVVTTPILWLCSWLNFRERSIK